MRASSSMRPERRGEMAIGRYDIRREVVPQVECLQHGLLMLRLVLSDHAVHVTVCQEGSCGVELGGPHELESFAPHVRDIGVGVVAVQKRQVAARPARVVERVVHPVVGGIVGRPSVDLTKQPVLLEVPDMADVPYDRAHDRVELLVRVVFAEGVHHRVRAVANPRQQAPQPLSRCPGGIVAHHACPAFLTAAVVTNATRPRGIPRGPGPDQASEASASVERRVSARWMRTTPERMTMPPATIPNCSCSSRNTIPVETATIGTR